MAPNPTMGFGRSLAIPTKPTMTEVSAGQASENAYHEG